jgi:hypothetical protein
VRADRERLVLALTDERAQGRPVALLQVARASAAGAVTIA